MPKIEKWLFEKEIIVLNGSRQVGKTSILNILKQKLLDSGVHQDNIFYLNLEVIKILDALNLDPENLLSYITDKSNTNFFLIDEIQYLDNPSNFLKHIYDLYAPHVKLIVTGSSSLEIKAHLQDSLVGRKVSFTVNPLNFEEVLDFKKLGIKKYVSSEKIPEEVERAFCGVLCEYLQYGGMPAVVLQSDCEKKKQLLEEYVGTYINKDVRAIGRIENVTQFNSVVKVLASQIGNLLNISELSNTTNTPRRKVEQYIDVLDHTFVLKKIIPFKSNVRAQISKMPKTYFFDLGIRNALLGNFLSVDSRADAGALFENFIFLELLGSVAQDNIFFYRTVAGSEIDFIVKSENKLNAIEVKFKKLTSPIDTRTLRNFAQKNPNTDNLLVVSNSSLKNTNMVRYINWREIGKSLK